MRFVVNKPFAALLVSLLCSVAPARAQSRIDCAAMKSQILKQVVHYCVYLPGSYNDTSAKAARYPVLYFLHGLGGNEQSLFNNGSSLLDDLHRQGKIGDFLIVEPEGRRSFYINSADGKVRYSDFLIREFIPQIETKYRIRSGRAGRAISGISMGGYGAIRLAFAHPEMFSAVSAQSAALITEPPQELNNAVESGSEGADVLGAVFGNPIDIAHWNDNSPFVLAKRNIIALRKLTIYFNCGQDDNFGFEKGAAELHQLLQKEKIPHEYHPYPGDHSAEYFLSHFAEVMEFHSHAFEMVQ